MVVKKSRRKNAIHLEEKENWTILNGMEEQCVDVGAAVTNDLLNITCPSIFASLDIGEKNGLSADWCGLSEESEKEHGVFELGGEVLEEAFRHDNTSGDMINKENEMEANKAVCGWLSTTGSPKSKGVKRPLEDIENQNDDKESSVSNETLKVDSSGWKKKCRRLVDRVKELESTYMPRPQHTKAIQYFLETANVLRSTDSIVNEEKNSEIRRLANLLGFEMDNVFMCKKGTATATARQLIRLKYPKPDENFCLSDVSEATIDGIIQLTQHLNGTGLLNKRKIRKAIGNYFATQKFVNKRKSMKAFN